METPCTIIAGIRGADTAIRHTDRMGRRIADMEIACTTIRAIRGIRTVIRLMDRMAGHVRGTEILRIAINKLGAGRNSEACCAAAFQLAD
jgi:hypothetical protein